VLRRCSAADRYSAAADDGDDDRNDNVKHCRFLLSASKGKAGIRGKSAKKDRLIGLEMARPKSRKRVL
jgi:hypothetical protein